MTQEATIKGVCELVLVLETRKSLYFGLWICDSLLVEHLEPAESINELQLERQKGHT